MSRVFMCTRSSKTGLAPLLDCTGLVELHNKSLLRLTQNLQKNVNINTTHTHTLEVKDGV